MKLVRQTIVCLALLTLLTGVVYPLVVTGIAQAAFPHRANGSFIERDGRLAGSELIGQHFEKPGYFWSRASATPSFPDNATSSGGSNLGPTNPDLQKQVQARIDALHAADPTHPAPIPAALAPASGSGLDPHISPAAADWQVPRVARARGMAEARVRELVARCTERRQLGLLGEPRVNVLQLNLALDHMQR
jgi:potassium-transporting ATPase KdpC subunit